jgi:Spy/CpxP family protein refolding chaperone
MKSAVVLAVAALGAATQAGAQAGMDCSRFGGKVTCEPNAAARGEQAIRDSEDRMRQQQQELQALMERSRVRAAETKRKKLEKQIAEAIQAGRCDDAKRIALDAGDLDAADKAVRLCTPAT